MQINFKKIDHLQICIPTGTEDEARAFYCGILGLEEIEKPENLRASGGFWLKIAGIELHIGAESPHCISKRHPAFVVDNLDEIKTYLQNKGVRTKDFIPLPTFNRFSMYDPFGNRIELLEEIK